MARSCSLRPTARMKDAQTMTRRLATAVRHPPPRRLHRLLGPRPNFLMTCMDLPAPAALARIEHAEGAR